MNVILQKIEHVVETILWNTRFVVVFAVLASLVAAFTMFYITTVDAYIMVSHISDYGAASLTPEARSLLRSETVTHVVEIVDGYLMATVMLIFALGLYELFIGNIEAAKESETASNVLIITNLDDLKARLAKVILMILIVRFFEFAIKIKITNALDLLYLGAGIALIGVALFLTHEKEHK